MQQKYLLIDIDVVNNDGLDIVIVDNNSHSPGINAHRSTQSKGKRKERKKKGKGKGKEKKPIPGLSDAFEKWWKIYPMREGKKRGKHLAILKFETQIRKVSAKCKSQTIKELMTGTVIYAKQCGNYAKDPCSFFRTTSLERLPYP